jgi:hypothetical protein
MPAIVASVGWWETKGRASLTAQLLLGDWEPVLLAPDAARDPAGESLVA